MNRPLKIALRIVGPCLAAALFASSVSLIYLITIHSPDRLQWGRYGFADLLLNYNAGFLRRALLGTWIQALAHGGPALPVTNLILFVNFLLLLSLISILALAFKTARYRIWNTVLLLAVPGGVFAMSVSHEFFYRKEIFFHTVLAITALAVSSLPRIGNPAARRLFAFCIIAAIFILGVALTLVHEGFLFLSAPTNLFLILAAASTIDSPPAAERRNTLATRLGLAYIGLMVFVFLALLPFHGGAKASVVIWNSLNPTDRAMLGPFNLSAIGWISHSFTQLISEPFAVLISGMAWFWLVPIAGLMLYSLALVAINQPEPSPEARHYSFYRWTLCYLTLLVASTPIFLVGRDWGRWIDSVNLSFLILWLSIPPPNLSLSSAHPTLAASVRRLSRAYAEFIQRHKPAAIATMLSFDLTFRFPESILEPSYPRYILYLGGHALWTLLHGGLRPH